ncbi:PREDICTED: uncharacterized protein LOC108559928 [Nicrophorus vespilloides]|uniref:Uncharacterized protein LOC108559928 n=1 Tax=Nicrophorus vespilloides TaxID=110193 RepID=A0ABM1ME09_NICVS|nr:PREDICTED: uncharacterized protein LOC108559928 [Nicrophorus vespilloides]
MDFRRLLRCVFSLLIYQMISKICVWMNISLMFLLVSFLLSFSMTLPHCYQYYNPVMAPLSTIGIMALFFKMFTSFFITSMPTISSIFNGIIYGMISGMLFAYVTVFRILLYHEFIIDNYFAYFLMRRRYGERLLPFVILFIPFYNMDEVIRRMYG